MRIIIFPALLLMTIFLAVGCKNNNAAYKEVVLEGTDWDLFQIEQNGVKQAAPKGARINMAFVEEGKVVGKSLCNDYTASYLMDGSEIQVGLLSATEKYCENAHWEVRFLNALKTAEKFELKEDSLYVFCSNSIKLSFSKRTLESVLDRDNPAAANASGLSALLNMFPELTPQQMHLYSILKGTNIAVYPFVGETLPASMIDFFDASSAAAFRQSFSVGSYVIGKLDSMYILRVPGNKGANSISLFMLKNDKLTIEMPLALANDDPSVNIQQDAWLKDLDMDKKFEIIIRQVSAPEGQPAQDVIRVFAKTADGSYQPSPTLKVKLTDYPLEKLK